MLELLAATNHETTSPILQTLSISIVAGVGLTLLSRRLQVPAIALLLIGGVVLGQSCLNIVRPDVLGATLGPLISLCVALILFEGGLTLNLEGYKRASLIIRRLLTFGVLITWLGTAAVIYLLFHQDFGSDAIAMSFLASSLVIVTGPTVIAPLLRRIRIKQNLNDILHWEGVLIDPIGVFIAILSFEFIRGYGAGEVLVQFGFRAFVGLIVGGIAGFGSVFLLRRSYIPDDALNIFSVAVAVFVYDFCDYLVIESGLLGVTIAGLIIGWKKPGPLKRIKEFKAEITELLIGALFVILAAKLDFEYFKQFGVKGFIAVALVMFLIRPLNVIVCTWGTKLSLKEKLFLSYVAPRGIVAASMASLFALLLGQFSPEFANESTWFLVTFTFSVIAVTVILQGFTAGILAKLLGLQLPTPTGWLIVGAHPFARRLAGFLQSRGKIDVMLLDSNRRYISEAKSEGLNALYGDARNNDLPGSIEFRNVGNVIALTDNEELNLVICQRWLQSVGRKNTYRWGREVPDQKEALEQPGTVVWSTLPKPSLISSEMLEGDIVISNVTVEKAKDMEGVYKLLRVGEEGALLDPDLSEKEMKANGPGEMLLLKRHADYLLRSIRPELMVRFEEVKDRNQLFSQLVDRALLVQPRINRTQLLNELVEREQSFPTALGHGIAVPHGYSPHVTSRLCAVAQIPNGIDFGAPDNEPVKLAFMIISPIGDPEGHLATMADIAKTVSDKELREKILNSNSPSEVVTSITNHKKEAE